MYIVVNKFKDLEDNEYLYDVGKLYPHEKKDVTEERIKELSTKKNKLKKVLIKEVNISDLNQEQLCEVAMIEGIDLNKLILEKLNSTNNQLEDNQELKEVQNQAKELGVDFSDDTSIEELNKLIEKKLKEKNEIGK